MSPAMPASHPIHSLFPERVEGFDALAELALDMRWTWNHATDGAAPERVQMQRVSAARAATDYTARVLPLRVGAAVPLEDAHILWQR